jgi:hypothetical protein
MEGKMGFRKQIVVVLVFVALALAGCGRTPDYVGEYHRIEEGTLQEGKEKLRAEMRSYPQYSNAWFEKEWYKYDKFSPVTLTISGDGTWITRDRDKKKILGGTYTADGNTLTLYEGVGKDGMGANYGYDPIKKTLSIQSEQKLLTAGLDYKKL